AASCRRSVRSDGAEASTRPRYPVGEARETSRPRGNPDEIGRRAPSHGTPQRDPGGDMAELIYFVIASLDGYIEDEGGSFDWATPSDEVHLAAGELAAGAGTHLYGRRMYETMAVW